MKTTHIKNGVEYQIGNIISPDRQAFDITVYLRFPTEKEYETGNDDVKLVGWHFGDYEPSVADQYIEE